MLVVTVIPAMIIGPLVKVALFGESQGMAALIDGMGASIIGAFVAGLIALGVGFAAMLCNRKRLSNPPFQMALYWVIALATPIALWIMQFVSLLPGVLFAAVR
ncbi:hypothetical protein B5F40_10145 [Gordonibacter sp. An230]|nr:hypothetical protein B5F40_10145 [Gordonibacter sp. An230]